ncbi:DUF4336 domain-containing protein [Paracoccus sp. (in: a-proteobacteria)]|uniref:DUF4336 domain-containing protein n=1 Tax=Paracoccus sp. TaxID=267 RepID=UPI00396C5A88
MTDVTYPPLDSLKPVVNDVWIVDSGPHTALGMIPLPVRMTVIRLQDGSLLLHSPTRFTRALHDQLLELGPIGHLVAPNTAHWTMLKEWQAHAPEAIAWGAPGLRERAQVQRSGVTIDRDLLGNLAEGWPGEISQVDVPGIGGFQEICLFHTPSRTLVLTDLIQNLDKAKLPAPLRPFLALAENGAPDGRTPRYLRAVVKRKGDAAREAGRQLVALDPQRVIFAHGDWYERNGADRLERALRWLLKR